MRIRFLLVLFLAVIGQMAAGTDWTAFDQRITALLDKHHIPGVAVAAARDGKLVLARAYGFADREQKVAAQPYSLFRIASISKTFTATAVLKLVDEGRLTLDTKVFPLLDQFQPPRGKQPDPRLADITVRQLLQHTGGWDADQDDPLKMAPSAARALNAPAPVGPNDLIRYVMGQPLNFDPGTRFAYSNFGYEVLGRVIERAAGMPYEDYVKLAILAPAGIYDARVGKAMLSQRSEGEVVYYDIPGAPLAWTQNRGGPPLVPMPYALPLNQYDACGAWIASAVDLVRFGLAMDEHSGRELLLSPGMLRQSREDRVAAWPSWAPPGGKRFYGLGWIIDVAKDGTDTWWHSGGLPGTRSILVRRPDGVIYAALFNTSPDFGDMVASGDAHEALTAALDSIAEWPEYDLSGSFR